MSYDFDSGYYEDGIEQALDREHQAGVRANERRRRAAVQPATGTGREGVDPPLPADREGSQS